MTLDHVIVSCGNCAVYVIPDWNRVAVGRTALPFSSNGRRQKLFFDANLSSSLSTACYPKAVSMCRASSNKRNPDFSQRYRGSSSKNKRTGQERENSEGLEENPSPSKNGPLVSLSNNQSYSATATPGRREKEIVELFRKVQLQLRERAAIKEEKQFKAAQRAPGERGAVESLLKLLRKHSVVPEKKNGGSDDGYNLHPPARADPFDQPDTTDLYEEEQHSSFFVSDVGATQTDIHDLKPCPSARPISSFRRKSPIPKVKFQPAFSVEEGDASLPPLNSQKKLTDVSAEHEDNTMKLGPVIGDGEISAELSGPSDSDETGRGMAEASLPRDTNFGSMKVSELRGLAKSKGIKGYSKLKKIELLELLMLNCA